MKIFTKSLRVSLLLCVVTIPFRLQAQNINSQQDGAWNDPATWTGGVVPSFSTASAVTVDHVVNIPADQTVTFNAILVQHTLRIDSGATLSLAAGNTGLVLAPAGKLSVRGTLLHQNGAVVQGTSGINTVFEQGSVFEYASQSVTTLPYATWHRSSTLLINNLRGNNSVTDDSWRQTFGNIIYDCPSQGAFMDFNARLSMVKGNLIIRSTNRNILRLARGHDYNLQVGGDVVIEGLSEVWFGESGDLNINAGGSFVFKSASTASSYLTLNGTCVLAIGKNFVIDANHKLKCTSSSGKTAEIRVGGDLHFLKGTIDALGSGRARIVFDGNGKQNFVRNRNTTAFDGHFDFAIAQGTDLNLGESLLSTTISGSLDVKGKLGLGAVNPQGPLHASGNVDLTGGCTFSGTAVVEYNGHADQVMNLAPPTYGSAVVINNTGRVICNSPTVVGNLYIRRGIFEFLQPLTVLNNFTVDSAASILPSDLVLAGNGEQKLHLNGKVLRNISVTGNNCVVQLVSHVVLQGELTFPSANARVVSEGMLVIGSVSMKSDLNGSIGPMGADNAVEGDVVVERFMAPGRLYRYLSFPVIGPTVADLKRSFPVTGSFADPSTGPGITSANPSLFYYDESRTEGWIPYPSAGFSMDNPLLPGSGYAAFIRERDAAVTWRVEGELISGDFDLPVTHTGLAETQGWNLVGNPYLSPVSWSSPGWEKVNIAEGIAVRDNSEGRFRVWNGYVGDLEEGHIALGQAFWVRTVGEDPVLRISEQAKTASDGMFYRKAVQANSSFLEIKIENGIAHDKVWLQLHPDASAGADVFDVPKLTNDQLSLSIIGDDGTRLAIDAMDSIGCEIEIPLEVRSSGSIKNLSMTFRPGPSFYAATFTLYDRRTGQELHPDFTGSFRVQLQNSALTELMVRVKAFVPQLPEQILFHDNVCAGEQALIRIQGYQSGVEWAVARGASGDGYSNSDSLWSPAVIKGVNEFVLSGRTFCGSAEKSLFVQGVVPDPPVMTTGSTCGPGEVTLLGSGTTAVHWFSSIDSPAVLHQGTEFRTPVLASTSFYFAAAYDPIRLCYSERMPVAAVVHQIPLLSIRIVGGSALEAVTDSPVEWFCDGLPLEESEKVHVPKKSGMYKVIAKLKGCSAADSVHFSLPTEKQNKIAVFPNPTSGLVFFKQSSGHDVIFTDILDNYGKSVFYLCILQCGKEWCSLDLSRLSGGSYVLCFIEKRKKKTTKVLLN